MNRKKDNPPPALDWDFLNTLLDSISDGVFTVDNEFLITTFNRSAEEILGIKREEAIGRPCHHILRSSICPHKCALRETMKTGRGVVGLHIDVITRRGKRVPLSITTAVLKDREGKTIGGVETFRDLSPIREIKKEMLTHYTFEDIVSKNHRILQLFNTLPDIAESDVTVLIVGPSGSGKELFARAIHNLSKRAKKPFVPINCGALPDTLLESELFGYARGAFTGADRDKPGRVEIAGGGTLFLDEIGDTSPAFQIKLLRFLEDREYTPLGSNEPRKADVRIITATNKDLKTLVEEGKFREDLYYRLNVIKLQLPPLRERKEDIPLLVEHFIDKFNRRMGKRVVGVSDDVLRILLSYDWPGNVRELENTIEHAMVMCKGERISIEHLPDFLRGQVELSPPVGTITEKPLGRLEAELIRRTLNETGWNIGETARRLGIHRTTLWRKIKKYGLKK